MRAPCVLALQLEPTAHAGEFGQGGRPRVGVLAGEPDRGQRRAGVAPVVTAGDGERELRRAGPARVELDDLGATRREALEAPAGRHDQTPCRGREACEGSSQLGDRPPAGVMVHLDVGDDGDLRPQLEKAGVALVGLGDDPFPGSPAGVRG